MIRLLKSPLVLTVIIAGLATFVLYGPIWRGDMPIPIRSVTGLTWGQPGSEPQPSIFRDRIVQAFPYHQFAARLIQSGHVPLWNPYLFAGITFFANGQSGLLSVFKLPFWWLPDWLSYIITSLLPSFIAAAGFAALARKLRWPIAAGVVAALTFTLSAPFVMRMTVTTMSAVFATLPWVLLAILRLHEQVTWRRAGIVAVLVGVMVSAGHMQLAAFALTIAAAWALVWWRREQFLRRLVLLGIALVVGLTITAIQLVPMKEALDEAYRQPHSTSWSTVLNPHRLFRISVKDGAGLLTLLDHNMWGSEAKYHGPANYLEGNLYVGPLALVLVLFSLRAWRRRIWRLFAVLAGLNAGLFIFPGWWELVGKIVPWITVTPVWRTSFALAFSLAMLAAVGMSELVSSRWKKFAWPAVALMTIISVWQWWGVLPFSPRTQLFPHSAILEKAQSLTANGSRVWFPNGALDQFMPYDLPISVGYDSVYPASYLELWTANSGRIEKRNQLVPIDPNDQVLAVTGSSVMITKDPLPSGWTSVMTEGAWTLAKQDHAVAPFHTVTTLYTDTGPALVGKLHPASEATVVGAVPSIDATAQATVTPTTQTATQTTLQVSTTAMTGLVTNLQYFPGWRLRIDGDDAPQSLLKVNHAFLGAVVPAGQHEVTFVYQPRSYLVGGIISLVSLAVLVVLLFINRQSKTNHRPE